MHFKNMFNWVFKNKELTVHILYILILKNSWFIFQRDDTQSHNIRAYACIFIWSIIMNKYANSLSLFAKAVLRIGIRIRPLVCAKTMLQIWIRVRPLVCVQAVLRIRIWQWVLQRQCCWSGSGSGHWFVQRQCRGSGSGSVHWFAQKTVVRKFTKR